MSIWHTTCPICYMDVDWLMLGDQNGWLLLHLYLVHSAYEVEALGYRKYYLKQDILNHTFHDSDRITQFVQRLMLKTAS